MKKVSSPSEPKTFRKKKSKNNSWNANRIVSISAITISLFTLFILIYQSRLLSRQFELAQKQQFASVLPYLEIGPSFGPDYFRVTLSNTGIGPAFIKDVFILYNGETYQMDLFRFLDVFATPEDSLGQINYSSLYLGRVLQPGAEQVLISSETTPLDARKLREFFSKRDSLILAIEYASVYDERWILENTYPPNPMPKEEYEKLKASKDK